ncbi:MULTISPECIES: MarR family winged helix-turn-helix transcriptional regulator [unclassified Roseivivax]|uniref:MarR family winged helix-turn-helix transcriptional regulator n=1 Tax=Roseivivax sp. GX 12232 TaxID=2900547 RepID=UPI001E29B27F|nr:MarR family transcriptional regulator [Roseivivax sp. GX 12232]MCE0505428.1 MarR family transcriptional regulator [Roseivivax sp. GX 12232]
MTDRAPGHGLEQMLCFDLYAAQNAFGRFYKALLDPLGLTYPQYLVMTALWTEAPLSVGQIGARLGLETNTVTPLLKRLEGAGLVARSRDAADERRVIVAPSEAGLALRSRAAHIPACVLDRLGMDAAEVARLQARLRELRQALDPAEDGV